MKFTPSRASLSGVRRSAHGVICRFLADQQRTVRRGFVGFAPCVVELDQAADSGVRVSILATGQDVEFPTGIEQHRLRFLVTGEGRERSAEQALRRAETPVVFTE